ncbi:hypothetical protein AB1Y20_000436 [Prymnesium parvum]|uniref:Rhomboid-like protein n=1 Tax=Prymnesium parvum TaxID=97485 RepID=A0AB34K5T3_PRYPA
MSVVWLRTLSRGAFYDYALGVGPIAAGFLLVPTLNCAAGREAPPGWPQLPLPLAMLHCHFTHTSEAHSSGRWWTCLTCGLCHADANARAHSLLGLLLAGWPVASSFGVLPPVVTFFCGTAGAALNSNGRDLQTRKWLDSSTGGWAGWVTPRVARLYNAAGLWCVFGGSPGVYALVGTNLCLMLEQAFSVLRQGEDGPASRPHEISSLVFLLGGISNAVNMVLAERRALVEGRSLSGEQVGHLTGFASGIGCYILFRMCLRHSAWWRRQPSLGIRLRHFLFGRRGGHVLGGDRHHGGRAFGRGPLA